MDGCCLGTDGNWKLMNFFASSLLNSAGIIKKQFVCDTAAEGSSKSKPCRLRPWLQGWIDSGEIAGLCWLNDEHTKFKIPWKHGRKQDWSPESGRIFMASNLFVLRQVDLWSLVI